MTPCIHTSLEKIHILDRGTFVLLGYGLINDVAVVEVKQVIKIPHIIKQHMATLPSALCTLLAGFPLPTTPPPHWWRRCGLWT